MLVRINFNTDKDNLCNVPGQPCAPKKNIQHLIINHQNKLKFKTV